MPIVYRIVQEQKIAYIKAFGKIKVDEVMIEGARMFAEKSWKNGYGILCDYREVEKIDDSLRNIKDVVYNDNCNEHLFDKSQCAIVAENDLVFGLSRMWEILSGDNKLKKMVFRDVDEAARWLGMDSDFMKSMEKCT